LSTMSKKQAKTAAPAYVTQGTVRLELNLEDPKGEQLYVVINPSTEYAVTHMGVKYTVFVPKAGPPPNKEVQETLVCQSSYRISVRDHDFLRQILKGAALEQSKVELELKANYQELELVGVKAPAPTEAGAASHR